MKKNHLTYYCDFIFFKDYFYTLFICWFCRLFGSFPALDVSEKEFIIRFYASYNLFLKLSWPAFLFFTFNLLRVFVLSYFLHLAQLQLLEFCSERVDKMGSDCFIRHWL